MLRLLYPYRIIAFGSNKHNMDDVPWNSDVAQTCTSICCRITLIQMKNSLSFKFFEDIDSSVRPQFMQYRLRTERCVNTRGKCFVSPVVNILFRKALKNSWVCFPLRQIIALPFSHLVTGEVMFSCRTKQGNRTEIVQRVNTWQFSRSLTG